MATSRLQAWKISVDTRIKGFHFRLKVVNALNNGWFIQNKSSILRVSFRANLHGAILRIKVAATKVLSKCGHQRLKWKKVKCFGEFHFKRKFVKIRGYLFAAKGKPNLRTTPYSQSKSLIGSYSQSLRNTAFTSKKANNIHNEVRNTWPEFYEAQLTSLMGNLSLLSYFVSKKERGAIIVQAVGVLSTLIVLLQLAIAGAMPLPVFVATVVACLIGFIVNSFNYKNLITEGAWKVWIEVIGIGGAYVLTQVIWSTFVPYLPKSELPGIIAAAILLILIELARWGLLPDAIMNIVGGISGWTATLLFMWSPVSQLYTNIRNPANIQGLSIFTVLLAMIGNGMLMPRALFIRDLMWFTGSSWGSSVQGWGILLSMYIYKAASSYVFWGVTCVFASWLGAITLGDMYAYSLTNPIAPIIELFKRKRQYEIPK
eukprot:Gb_19773 [translate_table: standard]